MNTLVETTQNSSLMELTNELKALEFLLELDDDSEELQEAIDLIVERGLEKAENYVSFINFLKNVENSMKEMKQKYHTQMMVVRRRIEMLEDRMKNFLQTIEGMEVKSMYAKIKLSELKPRVEVVDIEQVPDEFKEKIVTYTLRKDAKDAILDLHSKGIEVKGVAIVPSFRLNKRVTGEL